MGSRNRHQKLMTVRRFYISFSIKCENVAKPLGNFNVFQNASTVLARQASPNILCAVGACFRLRSIKTGRGPSPLAVGGWRRKYVCIVIDVFHVASQSGGSVGSMHVSS